MQKRLVTRYATQSSEAADENQRRVEAVFEELAASQPDNVSYIVLRLADDSLASDRCFLASRDYFGHVLSGKSSNSMGRRLLIYSNGRLT